MADVNITPFKFKHMPMLLEMLESNNYPNIHLIEKRTLPKIGYIAYKDKMPIAAGFLRKVEPCYAQIDTLVSNKYAGSILRHEGISKVVDSLIDEAKKLKLEGLIAHTQDNGILLRAKAIGFTIIPQTIIALKL